jgi:hypothetical protein
MIPLGIVSAAGAGVTALPTSTDLFMLATTEDTNTNLTSYVGTITSSEPNFNFQVELSYDDPDINQTITLEATLLDGESIPIQYQSVYFLLTPVFSGSPIQIGTSSLDGASSQTMYTDSSGKISKVFQSEQWFDNNYSSYTVIAAFDGNTEGTLAPSSSQSGRIRLSNT